MMNEKIYKGICAGTGVAKGKARRFYAAAPVIQKRYIPDAAKEQERFFRAQQAAAREAKRLYEKAGTCLNERDAAVFEGLRLLLLDEELQNRVKEWICREQINAEYALHQVLSEYIETLGRAQEYYMRERCEDLREVERHLLAALQQDSQKIVELEEKSVIISENLDPSQMLSFDRAYAAAFVTTKGTIHSHTAIMARLMGIPLIVGCDEKILDVLEGACVAVDADAGEVYVNPEGKRLSELGKKEQQMQKKRERQKRLSDVPCVTKSGKKVQIFANISCEEELAALDVPGVDGIGLFRSEWLYLERSTFPSEELQTAVYGNVLKQMKGRPVVIRTLDAGGDKKAEYMEFPAEDNPAMGIRGIRCSFAWPDVFYTQLRALYRASVHGNLHILFPMITSLSEVNKIKQMIGDVQEELRQGQIPFQQVPVGIMIETPAAAIISKTLAANVDFFSIGTNDLTQYVLAADRQNSAVAPYYEKAHPAVLALIKETIQQAGLHHIPVSLCGELGGDTSVTQQLLDCGLTSFSVNAPQVLELKEAIINCH